MKGFWMEISALGDVHSSEVMQKLEDILPASRIAYANRYFREEDRQRSLAAGVLLAYSLQEMGLSRHVIKSSMASVPWGTGEKPVLPGKGISFNLSHSGNYVVCVLGEKSCGVDIQKKRKDIDFLKKFYSPEEWEWVLQDSCNRAIRLWALKESYGKYVGTGIAGKLPRLHRYLSEERLLHFSYSEGPEEACRFQEYALHPEYALAVCTEEELPGEFTQIGRSLFRG